MFTGFQKPPMRKEAKMIDFARLQKQIIENVSTRGVEAVRKSAKTDKLRLGGYADEISKGMLKSDVRIYKRLLYAYNGRYYEIFDDSIFKNMVVAIMKEFNMGLDLIVPSHPKVAEYCKTILVNKGINPNRGMIPFQNYILDSAKMETYPHSSLSDTLYCLNYDYDPDADCPKWKQFLEQVLPGPGLIEVLQEYLGLLFVDRDKYKLEQMLVLLGGGSNGKSVVFETIFHILGSQNVSLYDLPQLTRGQSSEANLADIDGRILNYSSDLDPKDVSGGIIKRLISGEPMQARMLYKDPIQLKCIPLFICNANRLPDTSDKSHGWFRRLLIIPFNVTIKEKDQDKQLATKLRVEYPGILNWILEGRRRILEQNLQFTKAESVDRIKEEYKIVQDSIHGFIVSNRLVPEDNGTHEYHVTSPTIYSKYCEYCGEVGKKPYGRNTFLTHLKEAKFVLTSSPSRGVRVFCDRNPEANWNVDIGLEYDTTATIQTPQIEEDWTPTEANF